MSETRPKMVDLFCGAGGASYGYFRAGFDVVGVDINPQPNYPFPFYQADAMKFPLAGFDFVHASPPCQKYSSLAKQVKILAKGEAKGEYNHPDLVIPVIEKLKASLLPYIVENVKGSPLTDAVQLCGSSFGLPIRRHRLFQSNLAIWGKPCAHYLQKQIYDPADNRRRGKGRKASVIAVYGHINYKGERLLRKKAMQIFWMSDAELSEAIPPVYTEYLGKQVIEILKGV